jgi:hypothetical protein
VFTAAFSIVAAVAPTATGPVTATGWVVAGAGLFALGVAVVGVSASQVLPRLPAIDVPPIVGAPADTLTLYAAPSPTASVSVYAPTVVLMDWLTPVNPAVNAVIAGAASESEPALIVPVALVVSALRHHRRGRERGRPVRPRPATPAGSGTSS